MAPQKIMVWVDKLPEVGDPILKRREAIAAKMQQAAELQCQVYQLRQEAYFDALKLEGTIREKWTDAEISKAKNH
jgi:2-keto-4-pentenoate hydratase